jgi:RNA polymerase sigma factor (sigma-70 family)
MTSDIVYLILYQTSYKVKGPEHKTTLTLQSRLVKKHLGLVYNIAAEVSANYPHAELSDLVQDGTIGLMESFKKWKFSSYKKGNGSVSYYLRLWILKHIRLGLSKPTEYSQSKVSFPWNEDKGYIIQEYDRPDFCYEYFAEDETLDSVLFKGLSSRDLRKFLTLLEQRDPETYTCVLKYFFENKSHLQVGTELNRSSEWARLKIVDALQWFKYNFAAKHLSEN